MRMRSYILGSTIFFGLMIVLSLLITVALTTGFVYASMGQNETKELTSEACFLAGGEVRNTLGAASECADGEKYLGEVTGLRCPCICCQP